MATLILTAVGSALGGPVGGAIGAAIGRQADLALFAPKARAGARLKELAVQTSSYGTAIPAIFGAMRVAGTVIWATDMVERRIKSGGGKGRPATVNYSYSVSMAVALSSRPVARIGRIWADGNLIRGEAGDLKVDTQCRFYEGHDDQPPDPLLASAEANGQCPGHRGMAYVVFEDLQLADFGNRIPSLSFEVFERDIAVPVHAIFGALSEEIFAGESSQTIAGFALSGADAKDAIAPLLDILPVELSARDGALGLRDTGAFVGNPAPIIVAAAENSENFDQPQQTIMPAGKIPGAVVLRYYDRDRDYQAGMQRAGRSNAAQNILQIELPAALDAATARRFTETKNLETQWSRMAWSGNVIVSPRPLCAGDYFVDAAGASWKIDEVEHRLGTSLVKARTAVAIAGPAGGNAMPGRHVPSPDLTIGETRLAIIDLPIFDGIDPGKPLLAVFAAGTEVGWRKAALSLRADAGLIEIGSTSLPAIMGVTLNALGTHTPFLVDENAILDIVLLHSAMDIADRDGSPLAADAPHFWLGGEYICVGKIIATGNGTYRFSRLLRRRFAPEMVVPSHVAGEQIVLIQPDTARAITEYAYSRGQIVEVEAIGLGDQIPVVAATAIAGLAITPLAPVHASAIVGTDGSIDLIWKRRSRLDLGWTDGVEQALGEDRESYLVMLFVQQNPVAQWMTSESKLLIPGSEIALMDLPENMALSFSIQQIGRFAQSEPVEITIP